MEGGPHILGSLLAVMLGSLTGQMDRQTYMTYATQM